MTVSVKIAAMAAVGGLAGIVILLFAHTPALGGAIIGAALTAAVIASLVDTHLKQLNTATRELHQRREQYEAARATLASQRQRMRKEFEEQLAEHTETLNTAHGADLIQARREWFEEGFIAAVTGRLDELEDSTEASVIRLNAHRRHTTQNAGHAR